MRVQSVAAASVVGFCLLASAGDVRTLRQAADEARVLVGTAARSYLLSEPAYAATMAREYNMLEPEDALKWPALRPNQETFDFRQADELVRFAQEHQMKIRGHCLVWDHDNPDWLTHGDFKQAQLSELLHQHINRVMAHYAGKVFAWDVINEALNENGVPRESIWYNRPGIGFSGQGTAYIEQVFRWAHEADPTSLLFYNEAEGEGMNRKSEAIYAMLKNFKQRGIPIDGIGLQMHVPMLDADIPGISANMARLAALGLQIHITELDVSLPVDSTGAAEPGDRKRQADIYRGVVRACLNTLRCTAIQSWGFTDKYSWIGSHSRGSRGQALPFDRMYRPKAAYTALFEEISAGRP
jgi:endo-1,4-beta-xylanase